MGGRGRNKKGLNATPGSQPRISMTLREESIGKKQSHVNSRTMCKLDHLKNIAVWSSAEASISSLGAFLGERLAATTEALGLRPDPALFVCERCESIMQPGSNCTVRIEGNKSKMRRRSRKNAKLTTQNNVIYTCHFCSHRNSMRGTPKGYLQGICPPKAKPAPESGAAKSATASIPKVNDVDAAVDLPVIDGKNVETNYAASPLVSLLDSKRRKRNRSSAKKLAEPETEGDEEKSKHGSTKRRKKSWTSLKDIAQSRVTKNFTNLTIPFYI